VERPAVSPGVQPGMAAHAPDHGGGGGGGTRRGRHGPPAAFFALFQRLRTLDTLDQMARWRRAWRGSGSCVVTSSPVSRSADPAHSQAKGAEDAATHTEDADTGDADVPVSLDRFTPI